MHLRPAPYPYGLLTLRLLGKLGGKNRRVLRDPIDIDHQSDEFREETRFDFTWSVNLKDATTEMDTDEGSPQVSPFTVCLPIKRCVDFLNRIAIDDIHARDSLSDAPETSNEEPGEVVRLEDWDKLSSKNVEDLDLFLYCQDVINDTRTSQAEAALQVLRTSLTRIMNVEEGSLKIQSMEDSIMKKEESKSSDDVFDMQTIATKLDSYNYEFHTVTLGLMFGCCLESLREKELVFVRGLMAHIYAIVVSNQESIVRIDANGSSLTFNEEEGSDSNLLDEFGVCSEENLGSLKPFGYFEMNGPLEYTADPLVINKALADFLSQPSPSFISLGLDLLKYALELPKSTGVVKDETLDRGSLIYFESLVGSLCEKCVSTGWNRRDGLYEGLCLMVETLGAAWGRRYENELMNVALFSVKSIPKEMAVAGVKSFQFLVRLSSCLYGKPNFMKSGSNHKVPMFDLLSIWKKKDASKAAEESSGEETSKPTAVLTTPCDDVLQLLITEMASTKNLSR